MRENFFEFFKERGPSFAKAAPFAEGAAEAESAGTHAI